MAASILERKEEAMGRSKWLVTIVTVVCLCGASSAKATSDHLIVRFQSGTVEPPAGQSSAVLSAYTFNQASLEESLPTAGVLRLERLFPDFQHEDVNAFNYVGEPVTLPDLADI